MQGQGSYTSVQRQNDVSMFSLHDATQSLSQVKCDVEIIEQPPMKGTMLGHRSNDFETDNRADRIKRLKAGTKCLDCEEEGHWYKDRPEYREMVRKQLIEKENEPRKDQGSDKQHDEKASVGSFFRRGGQ